MMRFKNGLLRLFIAGSLLFAGSALAGGEVPLASHRAVYDLSLKEIKQDNGVQNVRGRIVMEVDNQCEGYVLNQRMLVQLENVEGGVVTSDFHLSTWENKSGNSMRFSMSSILDGQSVEASDGVATLGENDGKVVFNGEDTDTKELVLPKGVLFPTAHTRIILKSAKQGKNLVSAKVYDGNGPEGLQDTLTVIGKKGFSDDWSDADQRMKEMPYWPVQFAFFDLKGQSNEPDYEVGLKMYENGVATDLTLKYKEFSLSGKLVQLDFLDKNNCE
ncbi:cell envelope integrity EipB family protein [Sneathiella sp.]|jgi:hypothetical protein|uniref:cell envelope integrity EipB family protein n=1 Tax=Sneathiella sp. TaxID=1964365 RepID=UPI0039E3F6DC